MMNKLPTYDDVVSAAKQIEGYAHQTPVFTSSTIDHETGAQFFSNAKISSGSVPSSFVAPSIPCPDLQMSKGSRRTCFLIRQPRPGNRACSKMLGIDATIIMPEDAPRAKLDATRGYGAKVVTYNRYEEDRDVISKRLAEEGTDPHSTVQSS